MSTPPCCGNAASTSPIRLANLGTGIGVVAVVVAACAPGTGQSVAYGLMSTATPPAPGHVIELAPNAQGYVRVQTSAQNIRCSLTTDLVACQSSNAKWPRHPDGTRYSAISITAAGEFEAVDADLGQLAGLITMRDQTYAAQGWTIAASGPAVVFTNERSGHGMNIAPDGVQSF